MAKLGKPMINENGFALLPKTADSTHFYRSFSIFVRLNSTLRSKTILL